jgi:hypothetical protein
LKFDNGGWGGGGGGGGTDGGLPTRVGSFVIEPFFVSIELVVDDVERRYGSARR